MKIVLKNFIVFIYKKRAYLTVKCQNSAYFFIILLSFELDFLKKILVMRFRLLSSKKRNRFLVKDQVKTFFRCLIGCINYLKRQKKDLHNVSSTVLIFWYYLKRQKKDLHNVSSTVLIFWSIRMISLAIVEQ